MIHSRTLTHLTQERKYFDSGDYALSKAGKASDAGVTQIGSQHPNPENIPHLTSPGNGNGGNGHHHMMGPGGHVHQSSSPVKESSFLHRETSVNDQDDMENLKTSGGGAGAGGSLGGGLGGDSGSVGRGTTTAMEETPVESRPDAEALDETVVSPPPAVEGMPIRQ